MFSAPSGGPLRKDNFRRRFWLPAITKAGLEGVGIDDLRHTHAALLIAQNQHPKLIQERLGHASMATILDRYGHLFDGLDEAAADALDAAYGDTPVGFSWGLSDDQPSRTAAVIGPDGEPTCPMSDFLPGTDPHAEAVTVSATA